MQRYLNNTQRTVAWFRKAYDDGELVIRPPFQRNPVWSDRQKSALIDTILLEYPIPELYMQELTEPSGAQRHIIVDGQQRTRAVLSFLAGEFELDEESPHWAGLSFDDLSMNDRKKLFEYNFSVRVLPEMPDEELRIIFQRINRNTVTLNAQELRHATYWGPFIKLMEELADLEFWSVAGIFSANDRRRMLDVEYISELAVAVLNGLQNKKKNLEEFYQQYETQFEEAEHLKTIFLKVLGEIQQILPDLSRTRWKKKSDFYSLFLKFARHANALPLSAEKRELANSTLTRAAFLIDRLIAGEDEQGEPITAGMHDIVFEVIGERNLVAAFLQSIGTYYHHVERAASDLGSRKAREQALDTIMSRVFTSDKPSGAVEGLAKPEA